jgi:NAD(P)-dependent dehydrogenase (short-subunit alcohol dehydrogenase family)
MVASRIRERRFECEAMPALTHAEAREVLDAALARAVEMSCAVSVAINARSCFLFAKYGVPILEREAGGVIVNMASFAGLRGGHGLAGYSASKGAIIAFTTALAREVAGGRFRVNAIWPGWVDSAFNKPAIGFLGGRESLGEVITEHVPPGRKSSQRRSPRPSCFWRPRHRRT